MRRWKRIHNVGQVFSRIPYPVAYDRSPNRNVAPKSPATASAPSAAETLMAGEPYSCHVVGAQVEIESNV